MRYWPDGCRLTRQGRCDPKRSQSSRQSGTPIRPAIASRWITAFEEPPIAALLKIAFSMAFRVRILEMRRSSSTIFTIRRPLNWARVLRRASTAGMAALPGRLIPSASTMLAMLDAVPMVMQCPLDRFMQLSASKNSLSGIWPAFTFSSIRKTPVPEPNSWPRNFPFNIGPPDRPIVGRSQEAAPISKEGVVLSHPINRTTPSMGLPRIDSSTSMLARLRNSMAVGRSCDSANDMTGNSSGSPPASQTPRFTHSANSRKCALQGLSSDHVLQIPMTGLLNTSCGQPWFFIQLRYENPSRSSLPYHLRLRNSVISPYILFSNSLPEIKQDANTTGL